MTKILEIIDNKNLAFTGYMCWLLTPSLKVESELGVFAIFEMSLVADDNLVSIELMFWATILLSEV